MLKIHRKPTPNVAKLAIEIFGHAGRGYCRAETLMASRSGDIAQTSKHRPRYHVQNAPSWDLLRIWAGEAIQMPGSVRSTSLLDWRLVKKAKQKQRQSKKTQAPRTTCKWGATGAKQIDSKGNDSSPPDHQESCDGIKSPQKVRSEMTMRTTLRIRRVRNQKTAKTKKRQQKISQRGKGTTAQCPMQGGWGSRG